LGGFSVGDSARRALTTGKKTHSDLNWGTRGVTGGKWRVVEKKKRGRGGG